MPILIFKPCDTKIEVEENTKILVAAKQAKVDLEFGCGAGRCGICAVHVDSSKGALSKMQDDEHHRLEQIGSSTNGDIRLACRTKIVEGTCVITQD